MLATAQRGDATLRADPARGSVESAVAKPASGGIHRGAPASSIGPPVAKTRRCAARAPRVARRRRRRRAARHARLLERWEATRKASPEPGCGHARRWPHRTPAALPSRETESSAPRNRGDRKGWPISADARAASEASGSRPTRAPRQHGAPQVRRPERLAAAPRSFGAGPWRRRVIAASISRPSNKHGVPVK